MDVCLIYFDGCPSWRLAHERLVLSLAQVGLDEVRVQVQRVGSDAQARAAGFAGSPTILVDGRDLFPTWRPRWRTGSLRASKRIDDCLLVNRV